MGTHPYALALRFEAGSGTGSGNMGRMLASCDKSSRIRWDEATEEYNLQATSEINFINWKWWKKRLSVSITNKKKVKRFDLGRWDLRHASQKVMKKKLFCKTE